MLFGAMSLTGAAIPGIPSTMLAVLPIVSAIFALIGGILAFNQTKWGALFLFIATGLCAPARDTWLYGGLYFFAGLLCFFLKSKSRTESSDLYDDDGETGVYDTGEGGEDFYYMDDLPQTQLQPDPLETQESPEIRLLGGDVEVMTPQPNNEPPKLRRRMSKSCPECGAVVSRDALYCPTCGTKLFVAADEAQAAVIERAAENPHDMDIQSVNEQLFAPAESSSPEEFSYGSPEAVNEDANLIENDGDEMSSAQAVPNYRVAVKPRRMESAAYSGARRKSRSSYPASEAASSYTEFSKYAKPGKKPRRSAGRKILSMLLIVSAVGGALYFLLGLRKLPPGDLPPIAKPEVVNTVSQTPSKPQPEQTQTVTRPDEDIAEPTVVAVTENVLPNFVPERNPKNGAIIGSNVNVRADHSTSSSRVTRLSVGTRVEVIGTFNVPSGQYSGIWYNIRTGGKDGWVYGRYLQPLGSGIPSGYSNALLKTFGSSKTQMIESLGKPTKSTTSSAEWRGLTATLRGEEITRLRLTNSSRELQNGLKPGMSQTALLQIMGYPSSVN